jgi:hypothetical protein
MSITRKLKRGLLAAAMAPFAGLEKREREKRLQERLQRQIK